ncbi:MAG: M48 family metalloprotease [Pegethrix bostrychoides GSE-TBD4-15B]|jgi:predicted Zn-dependent protease|uniref:M48 family metalloprotease n=1 Tax=Pegethrix bostrychoides GSE-TBD4-15B TaxID=2839662 RepID=A0A951P670_9CYAN|nr:M48 family metalloprotease [Pegethrix bostrychoides GSE-TBD4-15B]
MSTSNQISAFWKSCWQSWRRRWAYALISLTIATGLIVATPHPGYAQNSLLELLLRGVQIIQLSTISDQQEVSLGKQINDQLLSGDMRLSNDRRTTAYVNEVGQALVPYSSRPNIPYTFQVVQSDQINAFATMGGYVYVTTGLLKAADNEAQLASVIGHEIGHIASKHALEQMRQMALAQGAASLAGLDRNTAVNLGVELALRRPNSRRDEFEADQEGLETLQAAGYAPGAMPAFMEKLQSQASLPSFLSTHPAVSERIQVLNQAIDPATANSGFGLDSRAYRAEISALP